jgi:hypothetical protein
MAFFFRPYPTISYRIPGTKKSIPVTDITRRFAVSDFIRNAKITFDEYHIQDGERPDIVANDYYDDPTLDWLILLTNEIQDPYYEWPLSYDQFSAYLRQKYGSVEYALKTTHHYEQIVQDRQIVSDYGQQRIIDEETLVVDYATYITLVEAKRKTVSIFDYENDLNDQRRTIYLLDLHYTQLIKEQHPYIFEEGKYTR